MRELGRVVASQGGKVKVELEFRSGCRGCRAASFCGVSGTKRYLWVRNTLGVQQGDLVEVEVPEATSILLSALVFLGPLAVLVGVYVLTRLLLASELVAGLLGLAGAFAYIGALKPLLGRVKKLEIRMVGLKTKR